MKTILVAIPSPQFIEVETFKSIYDLIVPDGYRLDFRPFIGDDVEQVRNLIANWVIRNQYDYLFAVDSDISFQPDTLAKLIKADKDIVSGLYIQRIPGTHTLEIMRKNQYGGVSHVDYADIKDRGLVPIDACGFGCVLVKAEVFNRIPYPHFVYKSAIDHANTVSEDVYFCEQARSNGFTLWADTSILCEHTGSFTFRVDTSIPAKTVEEDAVTTHLRNLSNLDLLPIEHVEYLRKLSSDGLMPNIIYDIGSSTLHWYKHAAATWPDASIYAFDAHRECEFLYKEQGVRYCIGVFSDEDGKEVHFYQNTMHPAGNSYYRENSKINPIAESMYTDSIRKAVKLDSAVNYLNIPAPDLIKIDVQGAELDILKGASSVITTCKDIIIEVQHVEYNVGAPMANEVMEYLESLGFTMIAKIHESPEQADYHFSRHK